MNQKRLYKVVFTGVDDQNDPYHLALLSRHFYPHLEWGVLIGSQVGDRFPSAEWLADLAEAYEKIGPEYRMLSGHLCGPACNDVINHQKWERLEALGVPQGFFWRIQLNTHAIPITRTDEEWMRLFCDRLRFDQGEQSLYGAKSLTWQWDGPNNAVFLALKAFLAGPDYDIPNNAALLNALIDGSHGAGVLPGSWPAPPVGSCWTGYAGGLSPENIDEQLQGILNASAAEDTAIWIDMETHLRSSWGKPHSHGRNWVSRYGGHKMYRSVLDLSLVYKIMRAATPFLSPNAGQAGIDRLMWPRT